MAHKKHEWTDPRSVRFRGALRGWAFSSPQVAQLMVERAAQHAWLPIHFETLADIRIALQGPAERHCN
jgi:hypothetical protein